MQLKTVENAYMKFYDEMVTVSMGDASEGGKFYHPDDDFEHFEEMIAEDLEDKGFSDDEIDEVLDHNKVLPSSYKFIAYRLLLENPFSTKEELVNLINNSSYFSIDEFEDEDLDLILKYSKEVDF